MKPRSSSRAGALLSALVVAFGIATASPAVFRAGAFSQDITPRELPSHIGGNFLDATTTNITDRLHARTIVLDDGNTRLALVVVDSCMLPREMIDRAKALAKERTGISTDHIMVSATHTHSAPAAMGLLGTPEDTHYTPQLPEWIAASIEQAAKNLQPAKVGWTTTNDWEHTHCRRWIYRSDKIGTDPFGNRSMRANMHPGYQNPDAIGPSGPVDPAISILSIQGLDGHPIALLANYSMHYYGATPVSADYYGLFADKIAKLFGESERSGFVGIMSQGTSGDQMWMDYAKPAQNPGLNAYAEAIAKEVYAGCQRIQYHDWVPLAIAESTLKLNRRAPDAERLEWARKIADPMQGRVPKTLPEVYAQEAIYLHNEPVRELKLQAIRIGDLGFCAIPDEVYAISGLKLKAQSPLDATAVIELANGAEGYIPTPEQHKLGGYTTWPARTAALEPEAEPKIVEAELRLLEKVAGKPRRKVVEPIGDYPKAILRSKPLAYWRLDEMQPPIAHDATGAGHAASYEDRIAFYLEGPQTKSFSGDDSINRSPHFAGGRLSANLTDLGDSYTVEFFFWNGFPNTVRGVTAYLFARGGDKAPADQLFLAGTNHSAGVVGFTFGQNSPALLGTTVLKTKTWNHVALVRGKDRVAVYLNGSKKPELSGSLNSANASPHLFLAGGVEPGGSLEGKLDEVAVYNRALTPDEIAAHEQISGLSASREAEAALQSQSLAGPPLPPLYATTVQDSKPAAFWRMEQSAGSKVLDLTEHKNHAFAEENVVLGKTSADVNLAAAFDGDRIKAVVPHLPNTYSVSLWFWNEMPNEARPVTGYLFSRGLDRAEGAPGDHLGIGGTHEGNVGKLIVFNGNALNQVLVGKTVLAPKTWNHVAFIRDGKKVQVYLNGRTEPEISGEIPPGYGGEVEQVFIGGRNDNFANFKGSIDEVAIYDRVLTAAEVTAQYKASGQTPPPGPAAFKPEPPRSPADSLRAIHVKPGFEIEQVVAEPLVLDPVAIDWGADGRLWVVEMADYPMGMDGKMKPGGRVRVLEDTDGDGKYDKSTIVLDGLNFPNGIATWRDGLLVTAAPEIIYATPRDGAFSREVLFRGFKEGNLQLRVNGLRWGLDNWVYCGNGWSGGVAESVKSGARINMSGRDIRLKPDESLAEAESGVSQFGRERDDWGNWFGVDNSHPCFHYVLSDHYMRRNPNFAAPESKVQVIVPTNPKVFPARPPEKRYHSFEQGGHFTSACGPAVYRDSLLFGESTDEHIFVCEPFHNLVHHEILSENGVTFSARRADDEQESEFVTSEDRWFRPVMARTGPDGALWIVDMYRFMIEHPDWLPEGGRAELEPFYRYGENQGRIYRVFPKGKRAALQLRLDKMNSEQLVTTLASSNGWQRDKAQQLLIWREDRSAIPALERMASSGNILGRLHALCTLDGLNALRPELVIGALSAEHPGLRREAVRIAERFPSTAVLSELEKRVEDPSSKVRLQLACSLGEFDSARAGAVLARLAIANSSDSYLVPAVLSSASKHCATIDRIVASAPEPALNALAESFLDLSLALGERQGMAMLLRRLLQQETAPPTVAQLQMIGRFLGALSRRNTSLQQLAAQKDDLSIQLPNVRDLIDVARKIASDSQADLGVRVASAGLLARDSANRAVDIESLSKLLAPQVPVDLKKAVIKSLGNSADLSVPDLFAEAWPAQSPELRSAMLDELLAREPWAFALLNLISSDKISPRDLDAAHRDRLIKHNSGRVKQLAEKLLSPNGNPARQKIVEDYRPALSLAGHAENGKAIFARLCVTCHKAGDLGQEVGPDLRAIGNRSSETLLASILDPNSAVDPRYLAYTCKLKSDEELYGIIASENENSLTLKTLDGAVHSVLRSEITSLASSKLSLMPEGLESTLTKQDLADLIRFLQEL